MQVNALIHATLASYFALYTVLWTCPGETNFFNDEECRQTVRNSHVWTCFFTSGYLVVETFFILAYTGVNSTLEKQALIHHVMAFLNYYIAFWKQDFAVTSGASMIFLEVSTPFV